jgi:methyl-accepting chemotaxis protein
VASAVEEQTATTQEITRSVNQAATGVDHIAGNIAGLAGDADESTVNAAHAAQAAKELADLASTLDRTMAHFRV